MAAEWPSCRVGDLAHVKHGFAFKGEHFTDTPTDYCAITPGNVRIGGGFDRQSTKYYSGPVPDSYVLSPGSLVVTMTDLSKQSDTLGYGALVPHDLPYALLHNQRIGLIELESTAACDLHFLHWVFRSPGYRQEILASASGTTVKHTAPSRIAAYTFGLPPIDEQRRITKVLGALDDRIELNRKMNETLEQMAQAIFKSWFIDFDGHTEFQDSPYGPIPKGWKVETLGAATTKIGSGATPRGGSSVYVSDGVALIRSQNVHDHDFRWAGLARIAASDAESLAGVTVQADDVLINITGDSILRTCVAPRAVLPARVNQHVAIVRPRPEIPPRYISLTLLKHSTKSTLLGMDAGGTRKAITKGHLEGLKIVVPDSDTLHKFRSIAEALYGRVEHNDVECQTLAELRDTLLPKLISGEIRIKDVGKTVCEAT